MVLKDQTLNIGQGIINKVEETLCSYGIKGKILYVSDPIVDKKFGDLVKSQIEKVGILKVEIVDNNTISYAMNLVERVIATDVECLVGLGGGRVLDVCKYASYIAKKPLLSIPTTMANDGICSPIAVLKRQDNKPKSLWCQRPTMLLLDTKLIFDSPIELIKAGIGDVVSNYMALKDWELAIKKGKDKMNGYAYFMSNAAVDVLLKTEIDHICPDFIEVLANSLVLSGIAMDFAGSSRPASGSDHLISHALDYYSEKANLHGIQVALGTVVTLKLIGEDSSKIIAFLKKFDVDINPKHLGIDEDLFIKCLQNASKIREERYTYLTEMELDTEKLSKLYRELVEIL